MTARPFIPLKIQYNDVDVGYIDTLDFLGSGVSVAINQSTGKVTISGGGGSQNLSQVLVTGNDGGGHDIANIGSVTATTSFNANDGGTLSFLQPTQLSIANGSITIGQNTGTKAWIYVPDGSASFAAGNVTIDLSGNTSIPSGKFGMGAYGASVSQTFNLPFAILNSVDNGAGKYNIGFFGTDAANPLGVSITVDPGNSYTEFQGTTLGLSANDIKFNPEGGDTYIGSAVKVEYGGNIYGNGLFLPSGGSFAEYNGGPAVNTNSSTFYVDGGLGSIAVGVIGTPGFAVTFGNPINMGGQNIIGVSQIMDANNQLWIDYYYRTLIDESAITAINFSNSLRVLNDYSGNPVLEFGTYAHFPGSVQSADSFYVNDGSQPETHIGTDGLHVYGDGITIGQNNGSRAWIYVGDGSASFSSGAATIDSNGIGTFNGGIAIPGGFYFDYSGYVSASTLSAGNGNMYAATSNTDTINDWTNGTRSLDVLGRTLNDSSGNIAISWSSTGLSSDTTNTQSWIVKTSNVYGPSFDLWSDDTGGRRYRLISTGSSDGGGAGLFEIYDATSGGTRLAINSSGQVSINSLTASQITATDSSKNLVSLAVATYPSLAELAYVKGVTSAIQTQLNAKQATGAYPVVKASTFEKSETGTDANVLTYTTGGTDEFLVVQIASDVSAITGTSIVVTVTWKDSNNATATSTLTLTAIGDGTINLPINSKASQNVVVSTVFVGVSTAYKISAFITKLN